MRGSNNHLAFLDGLRGLAALYVVIWHAVLQFGAPDSTLFYYVTFPFAFSHFAVDIFIILSGFCLMLPVIRNNGYLNVSVLRFYSKRARRILPPYYFAMILSILLIYTVIGEKTGTHWDVSIPITWSDIMAHLLLVHDVFPETSLTINHAFWSISVEWRIYFFFPLFVFMWRKYGSIQSTIVVILISLLLWYALFFTELNVEGWGINPGYFGLFALGMLSAYFSYSDHLSSEKLKQRFALKSIIGILMISFFLFALGSLLVRMGIVKNNINVIDIAIGIPIAFILMLIGAGRLPVLQTFLSSRLLVFIGTFAYSIYLIHAPVLQIIWKYLINPLNLRTLPSFILLSTVGLLMIIGISYLFFLMAERPFIRKRLSLKTEIEKTGDIHSSVGI